MALRIRNQVLDTFLWERNKLCHLHNKGFSELWLNCSNIGGTSGFRVPVTASSQELRWGGEGNPRGVKSMS